MSKYILKRLANMVIVILVVMVLSFLVTHIMPGDPVRMMLGDLAGEKQIADMKSQLGLDKNIFVQFFSWIGNVFKGDFGQSIFLHQPVKKVIFSRVEPTFFLALIGEFIGIFVGIPLGIIAAIKHKTWVDESVMGIALLGVSIPSFWLSLIFILIFGVDLRWFPVCGYKQISEVGMGFIKYLILPGIILGIMQIGLISRMTRSSMLDVLNEDYIRTARCKGIPQKIVIFRHALKNAMIPIITVIGFSMATLLGGTWVIETVFNIPGTGSLAISSIMKRDYPVIQGSIIFTALIYVIVNLITDISYIFVNPRIREK
ncbi:ABC transporter permease [Clostridium oceanicum]|uniref:ABC transporter permease n=1 Tax=Clostridium oceanicum TaxID=1543 RepID=A0ABP3UXP5_9CLOT